MLICKYNLANFFKTIGLFHSKLEIRTRITNRNLSETIILRSIRITRRMYTYMYNVISGCDVLGLDWGCISYEGCRH